MFAADGNAQEIVKLLLENQAGGGQKRQVRSLTPFERESTSGFTMGGSGFCGLDYHTAWMSFDRLGRSLLVDPFALVCLSSALSFGTGCKFVLGTLSWRSPNRFKATRGTKKNVPC